MSPLPPPVELERICKGLATLDAIVCEEWQFRYYSFDGKWSPKERMAHMRNGSGDDWFLIFSGGLAFMKCFWHEHRREAAARVFADLPAVLAPLMKEPALEVELVTFGGFHDGERWTLRGDAAPMREELERLTGDPRAYREFAAEYFELDLSLESIGHVLTGAPLDASVLQALGSERSLLELEGDLAEICYGA